MMDKYKIKDYTERLKKETYSNAQKMIYMWIKQEVISLNEYRALVKNIEVIPCCTELKAKKTPTFEHWSICNFEETQTGKYIDFNNGDTYRDKQVLKLKYNKIFKPTL